MSQICSKPTTSVSGPKHTFSPPPLDFEISLIKPKPPTMEGILPHWWTDGWA